MSMCSELDRRYSLSILRVLSVKFIKAVKCSSLIPDEQKLILDSIKARNYLAEGRHCFNSWFITIHTGILYNSSVV